MKELETILAAWEKLSDIPVDGETGCTQEDFLQFSKGTDIYEIWHWFDETSNNGLAYLMGITDER